MTRKRIQCPCRHWFPPALQQGPCSPSNESTTPSAEGSLPARMGAFSRDLSADTPLRARTPGACFGICPPRIPLSGLSAGRGAVQVRLGCGDRREMPPDSGAVSYTGPRRACRIPRGWLWRTRLRTTDRMGFTRKPHRDGKASARPPSSSAGIRREERANTVGPANLR